MNATAPAGGLLKTYSYEPYGLIRTESGSSPTNFFHFTGEYRDPTGLYHLRARQYDATNGHFMARDPLVPDLAAPYASTHVYAGNRPTLLIDPSGLDWCWKACELWDAVESGAEAGLETVGEFVEEHNLDLVLGGAGVVCFFAAPEASPVCGRLLYAAFASGLSRSAVESGVVGDRPTSYCRFLLSAGASATLFGAGSAISLLWKDPYVLSEIDRRILRAGTEYSTGTLDELAGVGATAFCTTSSTEDPGSNGGK